MSPQHPYHPRVRRNVTDLYREDMLRRLHDLSYWFNDIGEGNIACPICAALVHRTMRDIHITWHEVNNA